MPDPQRVAKWNRWIEQIEGELVHLLASRKIYMGYGNMVRANKTVQSDGVTFHNWVVDNYVTFVSMAIRRQLDTDSDSISLARLVTDIKNNPESMARANHVAFYTKMPFGIGNAQGNQAFTEHAGAGEHIDPAIAEADLVKLQEASRAVELLANRRIAHKSTRSTPTITFDDVDECIETIKVIAQKYILLLSAAHNLLEPTMPDWQNVFLRKWINK